MENSKINIEFIKAMIALHSELTPVHKDQDGYKFKYANLESIWEVLQPILVKNNLWFTQEVITENEKEYLVSTLYHVGGGYRTTKIEMKFSGNEIKMFGGAITYYRRYTIQAIFCITCTEDIDVEKSKPIHQKKPDSYDAKVAHINTKQDQYIDDTQLEILKKLFISLDNSKKPTVTLMLKELNAQSFNDIKESEFDNFYSFMQRLTGGAHV